jgi:hypothetical protein
MDFLDLVVVLDFLVRVLFGFVAGLPDFAFAADLSELLFEPVAFRVFLPAFTLRTPVTAAVFLTFATSAPRLCNGRRVVSGSFRYGNLGVVVTYVNRSPA